MSLKPEESTRRADDLCEPEEAMDARPVESIEGDRLVPAVGAGGMAVLPRRETSSSSADVGGERALDNAS